MARRGLRWAFFLSWRSGLSSARVLACGPHISGCLQLKVITPGGMWIQRDRQSAHGSCKSDSGRGAGPLGGAGDSPAGGCVCRKCLGTPGGFNQVDAPFEHQPLHSVHHASTSWANPGRCRSAVRQLPLGASGTESPVGGLLGGCGKQHAACSGHQGVQPDAQPEGTLHPALPQASCRGVRCGQLRV